MIPEHEEGLSLTEEIERLKSLVCKHISVKAMSTDLQNSAEKTSATLGRGFRRLVHITDSPTSIVLNANAHLVELEHEETMVSIQALKEMDEDELSSDQEERLEAWQAQERNLQAFTCFQRLIPNLDQTLANSRPAELTKFYDEIRTGGGEARSDDISSVSCYLGGLLNDSSFHPSPLFRTQGKDVRENRGILHDTCLHLMLPLEFEDTPETHMKVRSDKLSLGESFFIRLFYKDFCGDPSDLDEGFLKSKILVLLYKLVFTAPSSATGSLDDSNDGEAPPKKARRSRATRGPVADILNMERQVSVRSIGYIVCLALFALTDATQWTPSYSGFNFTALYNFIVDYFEDVSDEDEATQSENLLRWWNTQIFGSAVPSSQSDAAASHSKKALRRQRREKAAAAAI